MDIRKMIFETFSDLERNSFKTLGTPDRPIWQEPLIGIAAGDDPYFDFLKTHIGRFHWSPAEAFALKYEEGGIPSSLRVVSIIFPQTEETKAHQSKASVFPCDNWVVSRGEWEPLMLEFSGKLVEQLQAAGIRAVSIDLQPEFRREMSETLGLASVWSHRHAAFAAGLGTFGLSDGLITERGKAVRITSMIVESQIKVTPRSYDSHNEWCLYYQDGSCGACISRCPVSAITNKGHDKAICASYEDIAVEAHWPAHIKRGDYMFGCGLCQAAIPCQNKRP